MRHPLGLATIIGLLAALALPATAAAVGSGGEGSSPALRFYDSRTQLREQVRPSTGLARGVRVSERTRDARAATLRALKPEGSLTVDPLTGTPRQLVRTDGALSGPSDGGAIAVAMGYLRDKRVMLGLSPADLAGLDVYQRAGTPRGLTVVRFRQLIDGIPAFDNDVRVALDATGRVYSVAGSPVHDPAVASTEPQLSGADALAALARSVGSQRSPEVRSGPTGTRQTTTFAGGDFARLVLFGAGKQTRLGWHVTLRASSSAVYDAVVDAASGAILYRANLAKDVANADVYENHPGAAPAVTVDLEDFGLNPGATTLDGTWAHAWSDLDDDNVADLAEEVPPSRATTREFTIETSGDGTSFQLAFDGTGANEFTDDDIGQLADLQPTGATGAGVRFVRVTLLSPLRVDPECAPSSCSGTDFIDLSEFEVLGGSPNTLPSGSLAIDKARALPGETVQFDASSFTDPDSKIAGYDWDFDGDGTTDRSTEAPTTDYAYPGEGNFTAKVSVNDFRGGAATATQAIEVRAPRAPVLTLPDRGTGHRVVIEVSCSEPPCQVTGKLKVSDRLARKLDLDKSTIAEFDSQVGTIESTAIAVDVPRRVIKRAREAEREHVRVKTKATATDVNAAATSAKRDARVDV